ncbi:hypothetical protein HNQ91_002026 [Filimonas zeae]|uniref:Uncharacterized protein n=1 Tax=Filimonas zeae TaxID=1737353 RepID=A0A917IWE8_9BACT|nr:hypothetical protein [Filimonas zeae]MDR6338975.1 hypothetical protein [Filimonas zeae]GGH65700.1 hypothetical protein GCM10011379_19110 [Filimonas zeae]
MRNQPLQIDVNTLICLLTKEREGSLGSIEAELLTEWKQENPEIASSINSWNNVAALQKLLEQYIAAAVRAEALWLKLQQKVQTEEL